MILFPRKVMSVPEKDRSEKRQNREGPHPRPPQASHDRPTDVTF